MQKAAKYVAEARQEIFGEYSYREMISKKGQKRISVGSKFYSQMFDDLKKAGVDDYSADMVTWLARSY